VRALAPALPDSAAHKPVVSSSEYPIIDAILTNIRLRY
jgi:hypothetical protein